MIWKNSHMCIIALHRHKNDTVLPKRMGNGFKSINIVREDSIKILILLLRNKQKTFL